MMTSETRRYDMLATLPAEGEPMPIVGANRILAVEVNIGRHSNGVADDGGAGQGFRSSAVQVRHAYRGCYGIFLIYRSIYVYYYFILYIYCILLLGVV